MIVCESPAGSCPKSPAVPLCRSDGHGDWQKRKPFSSTTQARGETSPKLRRGISEKQWRPKRNGLLLLFPEKGRVIRILARRVLMLCSEASFLLPLSFLRAFPLRETRLGRRNQAPSIRRWQTGPPPPPPTLLVVKANNSPDCDSWRGLGGFARDLEKNVSEGGELAFSKSWGDGKAPKIRGSGRAAGIFRIKTKDFLTAGKKKKKNPVPGAMAVEL